MQSENYVQNPPGNWQLPGALGLGEEKATIITNAFALFLCLTPLPLGIVSDAWLGRFRTMLLSLALCLVGYVLLVVTALPSPLQHGTGLGGLLASMVLIGLGQGGMSAVMFAFIGDQIPEIEATVARKPDNRLVVVDRKMTIQFVFNAYFWGINLASLSIIGTTFLERASFWSAYLMPTAVLAVSVIPILLWQSRVTRPPLRKSMVSQALRVSLLACRRGFHLSAASPTNPHSGNVPWPETFISELRRGLKACQVMIAFIIFWLCYSQTNNNFISQAGQMELIGISNDTIFFLNVAAVVVLSPVNQSLLGLLRRYKIPFGPIRRITIAFLLAGVALAYAAGIQKLIYSRGPCYNYPLTCPAATATSPDHPQPNYVNVWLQTPIYVLLAASEILGYVSMTESAYAQAPDNMKAIIQALSQATIALGSAIGIALGPVSVNPWLVILFACLAGVMGLTAIFFWLVFRKRDLAYELAQEAEEKKEGSGDEVEKSAAV